MSRQSAGDAKIAELRTALTSELAVHEVEIGRLEGLLAAERAAMITKRQMLDRLGPTPVAKRRNGDDLRLPLSPRTEA